MRRSAIPPAPGSQSDRRRGRSERAAAEHVERERQQEDRERAAARAAYLDTLAGRVEHEWQRAEALVATQRPSDYDRAVQVLVNLPDLAARKGGIDNFENRLEQLCTRHAETVSLVERLVRARLLPEPANIEQWQ